MVKIMFQASINILFFNIFDCSVSGGEIFSLRGRCWKQLKSVVTMAEEDNLQMPTFTSAEAEGHLIDTLQFSHIESIEDVNVETSELPGQIVMEEEHKIIANEDQDQVLTSDPLSCDQDQDNHTSPTSVNKSDEVNANIGRLQDIRVDNWGNYCLQRLQNMYEKEESCDLVLQFHTGEILRVGFQNLVKINLNTVF